MIVVGPPDAPAILRLSRSLRRASGSEAGPPQLSLCYFYILHANPDFNHLYAHFHQSRRHPNGAAEPPSCPRFIFMVFGPSGLSSTISHKMTEFPRCAQERRRYATQSPTRPQSSAILGSTCLDLEPKIRVGTPQKRLMLLNLVQLLAILVASGAI